MDLTVDEIATILGALRAKYGPGYASDPAVAQLQAKLSVWVEVKSLPHSAGLDLSPREPGRATPRR